ncbi:MAG TPA: AAA family ATPase, partial [Thermoanaerobaculia bacterium]|nr:AAA family ATPase [Thermoanaerobaculia bacterium]
EGRSIDALEIDGATHGKVDQARDLIEVVSYAPVRDRRKVFIIDEVHAISSAAFQALLKTLEEPPAHAVFILATTERHKIPATILSRCQRFDFRRLTDGEVAQRLADIARREGFLVEGDAPGGASATQTLVETGALAALAAAATGSLRDGLSLFDQAAARASGRVTASDVEALLGAPDRSALAGLLTAVLSGDRASVLRLSAELEGAGADPRTTLHDLTVLVRGAVRLAADPSSPPPTGLSEAAAKELAGFAASTPYATLLRVLSLLLEGDSMLRRSDVPALAFEVLLLKLTELPRLVSIEEILAGGALPAAPAPVAGPPSGSSPASPARPAKAVAPARTAPSEPEKPRFVGLTTFVADPEPEPSADPGADFRAAVEKRHGSLAAVLEDASVRVEGKRIVVVLDPPNPVVERRLREPTMKKFLDEAAVAVLGKGAEADVEAAEPAGGDLVAAAAAADPKALEEESLKNRVASDKQIRKMLDLFGGEIAEARRDDREG